MDKDPVCGMAVTRESLAGQSQYQEKTYAFCSPACKERFDTDPQGYVLKKLSDDGRRSVMDPER